MWTRKKNFHIILLYEGEANEIDKIMVWMNEGTLEKSWIVTYIWASMESPSQIHEILSLFYVCYRNSVVKLKDFCTFTGRSHRSAKGMLF